jgi:hypothetical protein
MELDFKISRSLRQCPPRARPARQPADFARGLRLPREYARQPAGIAIFCGNEEGTMTITVRPIVRNGEHYVTITVDGGDLKPRGPFCSLDEAEAMADRLAAVCAMFRSDEPVRRLTMEGSAHG